jgi:hypothetical protein
MHAPELPFQKQRNAASNAAHGRPAIIPAPLISAIAAVVANRMDHCVPTEAYDRQLQLPGVTPDSEVLMPLKIVLSRMSAEPNQENTAKRFADQPCRQAVEIVPSRRPAGRTYALLSRGSAGRHCHLPSTKNVPCRRDAGRHFDLAGESCLRAVRVPAIFAGRGAAGSGTTPRYDRHSVPSIHVWLPAAQPGL